jgi:hypothetical protein
MRETTSLTLMALSSISVGEIRLPGRRPPRCVLRRRIVPAAGAIMRRRTVNDAAAS